MMGGFTDIHAHFVYGMDDGAKTRQEMESMLDAAYADGIFSIFATSHMIPGIERFDMERYERHLQEARHYCMSRGYDLRLYSGAEVLYTPAIEPYVRDHKLVTLADSSFVLMEFVPDISYDELEEAVEMLNHGGYTPILAHIERYGALKERSAARLKEDYDLRYQVNCNSVLASRGFFRSRCIQNWFKNGLIDFVATDMHDCRYRPCKMRAAYEALKTQYGTEYAGQLTGMEE